MSEMSVAFTMFKRALHEFSLSAESLALAKTAFKSGWEAREILLNKRVAEIKKAATLKERERAAKVCENGRFLHDEAPAARFGKECAAAIRRGE